ncbi:MAG: hypothetical protein ACC645_15865, partial [Pirellulales bacterium]
MLQLITDPFDRLRHDSHYLGAQVQFELADLVHTVIERLPQQVAERPTAAANDIDPIEIIRQRLGKAENDFVGAIWTNARKSGFDDD